MAEKENVETNESPMDPNGNEREVPVENADVRPKRTIRPTEKALEDKLAQLIKKRRAKLGQVSRKKNEIDSLMIDYGNIIEMQGSRGVFQILSKEFSNSHHSVQEMLSEQEQESDHVDWYLPKIAYFNEFQDVMKKWLARAASFEHVPPSDHGSYTAHMSSPHKAISVGMISKKGKSSSGSNKSSTASSVRRKAEAESNVGRL